MANETVKYHNDMASVNYPNFSPTDHKIFMTICYECKNMGTKKHPIYLNYLKELSGFGSKDDKRFIKYLKELTSKIHSMHYREDKLDGGFKSFSLFSTFETVDLNTSEAALLVEPNEQFAYILNADAETPEGVLPLLSAGYTEFELRQHNAVNSAYSMVAFRLLKRWKRTGWWQVSMEEFRRLFDVPESYRYVDIKRRVLEPIKKELPPYFENLHIEEIKGKSESGRPTTTALKFTFKPQLEKGIWKEDDTKAPLSEEYNCPACGEPLYWIIKDDGEIFYGHKDGWKATAPCRNTFSSLDEILRQKGIDTAGNSQSEAEKSGIQKSGFVCRDCGRPLYTLHNEKGEQFFGHVDGWKIDAPCRKTYGSVAEIRGYSETPTREDHAKMYDIELTEKGSGEESVYGYYEKVESE